MDIDSTLSNGDAITEEDTGAHVMLAARAFTRLAERRLRPLGIGVAHVPVLLALAREGSATVGGLARLVHVEQPTATALVGRMEAAGLVERGPDPGDRRSTRVRLSERGTQVVEQAVRMRRQAVEAATAGLSAAEVDQLDGLLRRVRAGVDRALADDGGAAEGR